MAFPEVRRYGWKPDHPDQRDEVFAVRPMQLTALPPFADLRPQMPPVFNQGDLGSCTANAACAMVWYLAIKEGQPTVMPSRLFEYYNTRVLEHTTKTDSGASIRDAIKAMTKCGYCSEEAWPYDISKFTVKPPAQAYKDAIKNVIRKYASVPQVEGQIKAALSSGYPVDFGFTVYSSFEGEDVSKTGIVPIPAPTEGILGGHSVLLVGYDDSKRLYIVRNSWGEGWGDRGYCYMPYNFVNSRKYASDFWVINAIP